MDAGGEVTDWNGQAHSLFGWSREEAIGRELATLIIPEEHRAAHREGIARFMRTGACWRRFVSSVSARSPR